MQLGCLIPLKKLTIKRKPMSGRYLFSDSNSNRYRITYIILPPRGEIVLVFEARCSRKRGQLKVQLAFVR